MLLCLLQSCGTLEWKSHWQWKQGSLGTCPWGARVQICVQAPSREILVTWSRLQVVGGLSVSFPGL